MFYFSIQKTLVEDNLDMLCLFVCSYDCVCFMDFDIWTADGDLIVLVYM